MSVISENQIKQSIQHAIKNSLINSKYPDEPISFGQAMVTHHFLQNAQKSSQQQQSQDSQPLPQNQSIEHKLNNISSSISDNAALNKQTIQWDLLQHQKEYQYNSNFGRKKVMFGNETKNIKDVFQWEGEDGKGYTKRLMQEIQKSPSKWTTEQRNNYRVFVESPSKNKNQDKENAQSLENGQEQDEDLDNHNELLGTGRDDAKQQQSRSVRISNLHDGVTTDDGTGDKKPQSSKEKGNGKKIASKKRPLTAKQQKESNMKKRMDNFNRTTRWLPDSAFTTYFGKPAFHLYGKGNIHPSVGGNIYGQYMLTHNVNPECGEHLPQFQQVYDNALMNGQRQNNGVRVPILPRKVNDEIRQTPGQLEEISKRNPIMPKMRKGMGEQRQGAITLVKPNLTKEKYFNSKHTTPNDSLDNPNQPHQVQGKNKKLKILEQDDSRDELNQSKNEQQDEHHGVETALRESQKLAQPAQPNFINQQDLVLQEGQDIGEADMQQQCACSKQHIPYCDNQQHSQPQLMVTMCQVPASTQAQAQELDPKNYTFLPSCWVQRIRPAGKNTYKSENIYNVMTQAPYAQFQDTI